MIKNGLIILFGNKIFLGLGTKSFKITTKGKMDILKIDFFFLSVCLFLLMWLAHRVTSKRTQVGFVKQV